VIQDEHRSDLSRVGHNATVTGQHIVGLR
jgi:hypothetical protein